MDPAVVPSEQFGMLFRTALPGTTANGWPKQIFASPLVYTATDGVQYVCIATKQHTRSMQIQGQLWRQEISLGLSCRHLPRRVSSTQTRALGFSPPRPMLIKALTVLMVDVDVEITVARNNPLRSFTAGIHHQRPGLLQFKDYIYVGFASHCIQRNSTDWIMLRECWAGMLMLVIR